MLYLTALLDTRYNIQLTIAIKNKDITEVNRLVFCSYPYISFIAHLVDCLVAEMRPLKVKRLTSDQCKDISMYQLTAFCTNYA